MTGKERERLWAKYPEARKIYEEYNEIRLEDEEAWLSLVESSDKVIKAYNGNPQIKRAMADVVSELDALAKRRAGYTRGETTCCTK